MDTPRKGLILATEHAIKVYIKDGCEKNLALIKQLEAASYQVWVESNTDFLEASFDMSDYEDDDWIWDDDYMFTSSGSDTLDKTALDEVIDDNSSVCSSIQQCDDSQSFHGYLASSEGYDSAHACSSVNESSLSISLACRNVTKGPVSLKEKVLCSSINLDVTSDRIALVESLEIPKSPGSPKEMIMCSSINSDVASDRIAVFDSLEIQKSPGSPKEEIMCSSINLNDASDQIAVGEFLDISNDIHGDKDDWVVVDRNLDRNPASGDWLVVSTSFSKILKDRTGQRVKHEKFECLKNDISHQQDSDSNSVDLSDWAVLSLKVTESDVKVDSKNKKNKKKLNTDIKPCHKHTARVEEKNEFKSRANSENHSKCDSEATMRRHCHCCSCFKDKVNSAVLNLDQKSNLPCMVVYLLMPRF